MTAAAAAPSRARPVTPLGILTAELADVLDVLDRTDGSADVDPRVRAGLVRAHALASGLDPYLEANAGEQSPALRDLAAATAAHAWTPPLEQGMLSGHVEGRLLRMLTRAVRAHRVLEIGMFTGYSALALAEALPADGRVIACELDPEVAAMARDLCAASPAGDRIEVRVGPAAVTLADLAAAGEVFDLVFLDADKAGYADYLRAVLDGGLLASGGLVCVDNTLMQGQPWTGDRTANGEAVAEFNRLVAADPRLEQVLVPLRDGLTLIMRAA